MEGAHPLAPAQRVRRDERLDALLRREIVDAGVASCAAVGWARLASNGLSISLGEAGGASADAPELVFDLASVTKPLTAVCVLRAVHERRVSLGTRVSEVLPEVTGSPAADATIAQLLSHRSGLPAWGVLHRRDPWAVSTPGSYGPDGPYTREDVIHRAASRRGAAGPEIYSDIGYVLLGEMFARFGGGSLAEGWAALGCADARTRRRSDPQVLARMPPTEVVEWRGEVRGEVHDENAAMLERVSGSPGHAGAFGSARDVITFAARVLSSLDGGDPLLPRELARRMIEPIAGGTHTLGWDLRSGAAPSSGARFGPRTFGHLGFTGTSVWIDPDAGAIAVLLTNRTWPSRDNVRIRAARPRIHDALWSLEP